MTATFKPGGKLAAAIECVLLDHQDCCLGGDPDPNMSELAYVYRQMTGRTPTGLAGNAPAAETYPTPDPDARIDVFGFGARVSNCLRRNGIDFVSDLTACTEADLTDIRSFGDKCLAEVLTALATRGLALKDGAS